jgi:hypothetical protein
MTEETLVAETTDEVQADEPRTSYSPIEVAQLAEVRPQMVYNYIKDERIPAFRNESGKLRVSVEDAEAWVEKYSANKVAREAKRQAKLEAELAGETPQESDEG